MRNLGGPLLLLTAALWGAACSSAPVAVRAPGAAAAWLGAPPRLVVRAVPADLPGFEAWAAGRGDLKDLVKRTRAVWIGADPTGLDDKAGALATFRLVVEGDLPQGGAAWMLSWNPAWKKLPQARAWVHRQTGLVVGLPENGVVTAGRTLMVTPGSQVLQGLDPAEVEASSLWVTYHDPGRALFGDAARLLPLERLDLVLHREGGALTGPVLLTFADERAARAASVLIRLAGPQLTARLGQDLTWTQTGTQLVGGPLVWDRLDWNALAQTLEVTP